MMLYFLRGRLPWQGIPAKTRREKYQKIAQTKMATLLEVRAAEPAVVTRDAASGPHATPAGVPSLQELNAGFPEEFASFLKYCRTLRFASDPDYTEIRAMFRRAAERLGVEYDNQYDWVIKNKTTPTGDEDESKSGR